MGLVAQALAEEAAKPADPVLAAVAARSPVVKAVPPALVEPRAARAERLQVHRLRVAHRLQAAPRLQAVHPELPAPRPWRERRAPAGHRLRPARLVPPEPSRLVESLRRAARPAAPARSPRAAAPARPERHRKTRAAAVSPFPAHAPIQHGRSHSTLLRGRRCSERVRGESAPEIQFGVPHRLCQAWRTLPLCAIAFQIAHSGPMAEADAEAGGNMSGCSEVPLALHWSCARLGRPPPIRPPPIHCLSSEVPALP